MTAARHRAQSQALVEFSLAAPLLLLFVFAVIQLSLLFVWFYSQTTVTRDMARWLAVHANATDDVVASQIERSLLPGMIGGTARLTLAGTRTSDSVYQVGNLTAQFTPCLPAGVPTVCTHADRAAGSTLHMQMSYDASNVIFLPVQFQLGWLSVHIPTGLPPYTVYVMAE